MVRHTFRVWTVFSLALLMNGSVAQSQTATASTPATLPEGWQQFVPDDLAAAVRPLYAVGRVDNLSPSDHDALRARGRELFLQVDLSKSAVSYQTLEMLHWLTRFQLEPDVVNRMRDAILARQDNWAGQPFEEVLAKFWIMYRLQIDDATKYAELRRWVAAGGTVDQIPASEMHYYVVRQCLVDGQLLNGSFTVTWNGLVTAPKSGQYVFSISPINVNANNPHEPVKFTMAVSVNGQSVVNSSPDSGALTTTWVSTGAPVSLTVGRPVPLKATVTFEGPKIPAAMLHAVLFWQGPGGAQAVVPTAALSPPNGQGSGLQATYNWTANGQPQTLTRTEPNIDVSWSNPPIVLAQDSSGSDQAAQKMWQTMSSSSFLKTCLGPPLLPHPFFREPDSTSSALTSAQRSAFQALLLQNPGLLDAIKLSWIVDFYQAHRFGASESALDVFGTWAGRNADWACIVVPGTEFDADTRNKTAVMAVFTTLQLPNHINRLQNEYLQTADGRCSLPVAYTLAASYQGRGKLNDWTAFLDTRLNDSTLVGDLRVNWLIARAEAEEIRYLPQELDTELAFHVHPRALDGRGYLDQALEAATSPAVIGRVTQELVARLVWSNQLQEAQALLAGALPGLPNDQQAPLVAWQSQITQWAAEQAEADRQQTSAANEAYVKTLQDRRNQAAARGDSAAVSRYNGLISAAGGQ